MNNELFWAYGLNEPYRIHSRHKARTWKLFRIYNYEHYDVNVINSKSIIIILKEYYKKDIHASYNREVPFYLLKTVSKNNAVNYIEVRKYDVVLELRKSEDKEVCCCCHKEKRIMTGKYLTLSKNCRGNIRIDKIRGLSEEQANQRNILFFCKECNHHFYKLTSDSDIRGLVYKKCSYKSYLKNIKALIKKHAMLEAL